MNEAPRRRQWTEEEQWEWAQKVAAEQPPMIEEQLAACARILDEMRLARAESAKEDQR